MSAVGCDTPLTKRSPSSMLCNNNSSLNVRGAESAVHCGEAAQRGLAPCTAHPGSRRAPGGAGGALGGVPSQGVWGVEPQGGLRPR